jgi:xylono-1,5-lactonase
MAIASEPRSICAVEATLGEGPVWAHDALWFVDIKQHRVFRLDPDSGTLRRWEAPSQVGWVLPAVGGGFVAGLQTGLHRFDPATGAFAHLAAPEAHRPSNRLNDAAVGRDGALWFGSMDDAEEAATGHVYRYAGGEVTRTDLDPVAIVNGPALSPDGATLYHVDTLGRRIWAVPLGPDGLPGTPDLLIEIEQGAGHPDGPTIDAEGHLWIGLYGGWGVRRYAPDGRLVAHVDFPVANVTKIAFGGDGLRTAYATTASKGLDADARRAQPLAGHLFAFDPGVAGLPVHSVQV